MTERIHSFTVVLAQDIREDDADQVRNALQMVKGVISVTPNVVSFLETHVAEQRVRNELGGKLLKILYPDTP